MPERATSRVEQAFARLRATEPKVHAFVHTLESQALAEARWLDGEAHRGPLHGVPFAVKEVFDVAGVETSGGSKALAGHVADADAAVIARSRRAGAILIGTQVSHELTCGLDEPPTRNPWNLACYPGGSSAGAGVSVAVGSASFALGTDAAGSVRIPAAMCGVVGFKPSAGAISKSGVMRRATAPSIDNVGIVARDVALTAAVFEVVAFADPGDPQTLLRRPIAASEAEAKRRIAVLGARTTAALDRIHECEADIRAAFETACSRLLEAGAELVEIEAPTLAQASGAASAFFSQELAFAHRSLLEGRRDDYHPDVREMLAATLASASSLDEAVAIRARLRAEIEDGLAQIGAQALLTPTTPRVAMPLATFRPKDELGTLIPYTCGVNLTGHPAISLPNGFDRNCLPIGIQLVGRIYQDAALLRFAAEFERAAPGHFNRRPDV